MTTASTPLQTYYTPWQQQHQDAGNTLFCTPTKFRMAWYGYLSLLDVDWQLGFRCSVCGPSPEVLDCTSGNGRCSTKASWDPSSRIFIADSQLRSTLGHFTGTGSPLDERELNTSGDDFFTTEELSVLHCEMPWLVKMLQQFHCMLPTAVQTILRDILDIAERPFQTAAHPDCPRTSPGQGASSQTCQFYGDRGFTRFSWMGSCESPNTPFTVFKTRFETVPKTIIYDNACNLHSYFLNREPVSIRSTRFVVDGLHWKNHTCSSAYNSKQYPNLMSVNTHIVEQANSTLKKLRTQISYMTPDQFVQHLALFILK